MITEDYCSFEIAKLLKEKGFEGDINAYYHIWDNGNKVCSVQEFNHSEAPHLYIPAPTHQMAMKWLREEKHLAFIISPQWLEGDVRKHCWWYCEIRGLQDRAIDVYNLPLRISYEEAVEAALKYVLKNLI